MNPGARTRPAASITVSPDRGDNSPTAATRSPSIRTEAVRAGAPVPSIRRAFRISCDSRSSASGVPPQATSAAAISIDHQVFIRSPQRHVHRQGPRSTGQPSMPKNMMQGGRGVNGRAMISSLTDRRHFPTLEAHRYLNQASLGLIGQPAVQAMHRFIDDTARHGNCRMSDEDESHFLDPLRAQASKMFSCQTDQVAVVSCASEILSQLPMLLRISQDGTVIAVKTDFPSVTWPWLRQEILGRVRLRFVDDHPSECLTDALIDAIDDSTSVVAVSSVQFATGTSVDIGRLGDAVSAA